MRVPGWTRVYITAARSTAYSERTARARTKIVTPATRRARTEGARPIPSAAAAASRQVSRTRQFTRRTAFARVRPPPLTAGPLPPARYNRALPMPLTAPSASFLAGQSAILVFILLGIAFLAVNLVVWSIIRPSRFSEEKLTTYECGENPTG